MILRKCIYNVNLKHLSRNFWSFNGDIFKKQSGLTKKHYEQTLVPFSCTHFYDVVADISQYKNFLPFCVDSRVLKKEETTSSSQELIKKSSKINNYTVLEADLKIGFRLFTETYRSQVILYRPNKILIKSIKSPTFKQINSEWIFRPTKDPNLCVVDFTVFFEVSSPLYAQAMSLFFNDVANTQMRAFINRAHELKQINEKFLSDKSGSYML